MMKTTPTSSLQIMTPSLLKKQVHPLRKDDVIVAAAATGFSNGGRTTQNAWTQELDWGRR